MGWFNFGSNDNTTTTVASTDTDIGIEVVEKYEMQDVVGLSETAASKILTDAGFTNVRFEHENNPDVQEGYVFEQSADKGTSLRSDAEIVIKVSAGAAEIQVPDVTNYEDERAVTILQEAGFTVTHSFESNDDIEKDKVIRTEPAAGSMAAEGSKIILVVSNDHTTCPAAWGTAVGKSRSPASPSPRRAPCGTASCSGSRCPWHRA